MANLFAATPSIVNSWADAHGPSRTDSQTLDLLTGSLDGIRTRMEWMDFAGTNFGPAFADTSKACFGTLEDSDGLYCSTIYTDSTAADVSVDQIAQIIDPASLDAGGRVVFGATVDLALVPRAPSLAALLASEFRADLRRPIDIHISVLRHLLACLVLNLAHAARPTSSPAFQPSEAYLRFRDAEEAKRPADGTILVGYDTLKAGPEDPSQPTNLDVLEKLVAERLPESEHFFPEDQITDRSSRFLAAELVREKIMRQLGAELPYQITVEIEEFKQEGRILHIHALILVEREGQKKIIIGDKGERIKSIG